MSDGTISVFVVVPSLGALTCAPAGAANPSTARPTVRTTMATSVPTGMGFDESCFSADGIWMLMGDLLRLKGAPLRNSFSDCALLQSSYRARDKRLLPREP